MLELPSSQVQEWLCSLHGFFCWFQVSCCSACSNTMYSGGHFISLSFFCQQTAIPIFLLQFHSSHPPPANETWLIPTCVPQVLDKSLWSARLRERGSRGAALPGRSQEQLPGLSGWVGFGGSRRDGGQHLPDFPR